MDKKKICGSLNDDLITLMIYVQIIQKTSCSKQNFHKELSHVIEELSAIYNKTISIRDELDNFNV
jgi:hypothetical protein